MAVSISLPTKTVQIDEFTYTITTLDAVSARRIWVRLFKAIGAGAESAASDEAGVMRFLSRVVQALPEDLVEEMADTYARSCTVHYPKGELKVAQVFGMHFAGRPAHYGRWLVECSKVNFADFLDGLTSLKGSASTPAAASA